MLSQEIDPLSGRGFCERLLSIPKNRKLKLAIENLPQHVSSSSSLGTLDKAVKEL
jgi:hypothetical protein